MFEAKLKIRCFISAVISIALVTLSVNQSFASIVAHKMAHSPSSTHSSKIDTRVSQAKDYLLTHTTHSKSPDNQAFNSEDESCEHCNIDSSCSSCMTVCTTLPAILLPVKTLPHDLDLVSSTCFTERIKIFNTSSSLYRPPIT